MSKEITIVEQRAILVDVLQTVHDFCVSHDIKYSLAYGTLLGAVRHKGFIPWDDDIDIAMLRDDYEKFAQLFNKENDIYRFYECRNDKEVNLVFGKVADTRTMVIEGANSKNLGIAIDIFPIDDFRNTIEESQRYYDSLKFKKMVFIMKCRKVSDVRSFWKKPIYIMAKLLFIWYPLHKMALSIINNLVQNRFPDSQYVGFAMGLSKKMNQIEERKVWTEYCELFFEGRSFMAIKEYDKYLTREFGDYMKLPSEKDRVPKHDFYKIYWL